LLLSLAALVGLVGQRSVGAVPDTSLAVERFAEDIEKQPIPYQAVRRLEASTTRNNESAWLEAFTEYTPAAGFTYRVLGEGGSERIRNRALKGVLEAERASLAEWRKGALTRENYEFAVEGRAADGLLGVRLTPRRRDSRLVEGVAWLTEESGGLVRLEGRLSKSPSFWVKWVSLTRRYTPIHGTVMPASVESTADVRIAGVSRFSMTYQYAAIDGHPIVAAPAIFSR